MKTQFVLYMMQWALVECWPVHTGALSACTCHTCWTRAVRLRQHRHRVPWVD